ncbi:MAG: hypothetical protein KF681_14485 [Bdellovibrionaceae bacterium]|nr:hypothetical protein [Pseudobdellovibrionaceae bacterium]
MILRGLVLAGSLALILARPAWAAPKTFRLHLFSEPTTLSPFTQKNSNSSYFLTQLACPLMKWDGTDVRKAGADCRIKKKTTVECTVDKDLRFQDGTPVTAEHYAQSLRQFLDPEKPSPRAELLLSIKNAGAILKKEKPLAELGLKADKQVLQLSLEREDPEILLRLANPLFTAIHSVKVPTPSNWKEFKSCGAYRLGSWENGRAIKLEPNRVFKGGHPDRPTLEFLFVSEDSLALQYYQKNELDFLRRLPTLYIPAWKNKPDYKSVQQIRFDSFLLSPDFRDAALAAALAQSIDFEAWRQLYAAEPRPGCFGLPAEVTDGPICWDFDPKAAKASLAQIKDRALISKLRLFYSKQGGDDHDRTMEFLQDQWKKNLGIEVRTEAQENKIFLENLRAGKMPFFRKGLAPDRASCLAVLENFRSDHAENFAQFRSPDFDRLVDGMAKRKPSDKAYKKACREGIEKLKTEALLIPTGPIYFSVLAKPEWQGWTLNNLNHLDLSQLHPSAGH